LNALIWSIPCKVADAAALPVSGEDFQIDDSDFAKFALPVAKSGR
jgi:hypothetical protein